MRRCATSTPYGLCRRCRCSLADRHHVHRCQCGTQWADSKATDDRSQMPRQIKDDREARKRSGRQAYGAAHNEASWRRQSGEDQPRRRPAASTGDRRLDATARDRRAGARDGWAGKDKAEGLLKRFGR